MKVELMESMLRHGEYDKLIEQLEQEENLGEKEKLTLAQAYLLLGNDDKASKLAHKLINADGEDSVYKEEAKKIVDAFFGEDDALDNYRQELKTSFRKQESTVTEEKFYLEEIEDLFEETVGMEQAKKSLQAYISCCSLDEERDTHNLLRVTEELHNFAIVGDRGSGKNHLVNLICSMLNYEEDSQQTICMRNIKEKKDLENLFQCHGIVIIIDNIEDFFLNDDVSENIKKDVVNCFEDLMIQNVEEDGCIVILTGNLEAMEKIKQLNPALENLFFDFINIEKYSVDELWEIFNQMAMDDAFRISPECEDDVRRWLASESKLKEFTNTIALKNLLNEAKKNLALRYKKFEIEEGENILHVDEDKMIQKLCRLEQEDFVGNGNEKTIDELCSELENMTGLARVKKEVRAQIARVNISMKAAKAGAKRKDSHGTLHMAFVGEPGTGKTTVAKMVGKIYCALGVLPGDEVYTVSRADLVSQYIGGTARCVKEVCQRADGGVLFIDEAYSLVNSDQDSYGKEAVDTLIQEMENRRDTMMVILAGYEKPMMEFFKANPGFKSRVPNIIHFDDYELEEMTQIFENMAVQDGYYLDADALSGLSGLLTEKSKEADFGNARGVRNVLDQVIAAQSQRLSAQIEQGDENVQINYDELTGADIAVIQKKVNTEEKTIEQLLAELDRLEGLQSVKKQVNDMVNSMKYINLMKARGLNPGRNQGTMHLIFSGNPGTGKSTVASLLGQIYVKLGVLKKNTFILAKRSDLVAQYMGQTAARVANKVAEADGGILFIDEAYQLYNGENDSYGEEAIGTLLSLVEEKRDSLMVILAGYTENMDEFLAVNPGLRSRFPNIIEFTDYSVSELLNIFEKMADSDGKKLENGVLELVKQEIENRRAGNPKEFANARGVRNILDEIILKQRSRIIREEIEGKQHTDDELVMIIKDDIRK